MSRASKIYITWPFNIQIAEINLHKKTYNKKNLPPCILQKLIYKIYDYYSELTSLFLLVRVSGKNTMRNVASKAQPL
jgi:hypothetical protein